MFYGEYAHSIDNKGRLILPSKLRETAKNNFVEKFYITRGLDKCLFMFSEEEWKAAEQKFKSMSFTKQDSRKFNRLYFSGAVEIIPDKQGRILLPPYLKDFAQIKRDVVIIGVSSRIEVWAKDQWQEFYRSNLESFEDTAEKLIENL
ncbi:MAG: cell division/cell wall cluster transcriptional repressor MraZ [Candidatus Omnitrophica bacterium CG1_02_44_16]|nr:MAG: cell division/cell wall cluster transcriptional repressor MraZ [Candidatus Omnitrophica bacterium CG1_02_44_16]PIY83652.1 MAG: cell division/cell wall cluster transcriptional repressor MraZ [Candidatus Omnitrophica bacterium CG_4_10_14_0_8_um_filter_44_12]PIZ85078.1 MAG: cell division/cell wall cluster transcriptional repressor MraZ [Candidatus Omnitrophica bacterium CG_4_10_14_0_2_um_filter_44_9]